MFAGACWAITNIFGMNLGLPYDAVMGDTYLRFKQVLCLLVTQSKLRDFSQPLV